MLLLGQPHVALVEEWRGIRRSGRTAELGLWVATAAKGPCPVVAFEAILRPGVISQTEPGSRVIYSMW